MPNSTLILIYTEKQFRTYIESGAFTKLTQLEEVTFIFRSNLKKKIQSHTSNIHYINAFPKILHRSGTLLATLLLWSQRFRSPSHALRAHSSFGNKEIRKDSMSMILYNMEGWSDLKRFLIRSLAVITPRKLVIYFRHIFISRFMNNALRRIEIDLNRFSFVFIPFSGLLTREFDDYVDFFNNAGITTIAIQENWDNLSSKTFIDSSPRYFCVWGEQSAAHLKTIHRLESTVPVVTGSPRFLPYVTSNHEFLTYRKLPSSIQLKSQKPFVLFTGTGDGIDDLFILNETIAGLKNFQKYKLVYRPHPFTRNPIDDKVLSVIRKNGVLIDSSNTSKSVFHHCGLVYNASLVINQFSTMLLESLSCNTKVLLPTFVNREVNYDYSRAIDEWFHFIGLKAFPNVYISKTRQSFHDDLINAIEVREILNKKAPNWMCAQVDSRIEYLKLISKLRNTL